jgi:hypothetical protein
VFDLANVVDDELELGVDLVLAVGHPDGLKQKQKLTSAHGQYVLG